MIFKSKILSLFIALFSAHALFGEPKLIIESPKDENMTVYESSVTFKGQAKETSKLTINGQEIPINTAGNFNYTIQLNSKNGNNYFLIEDPMHSRKSLSKTTSKSLQKNIRSILLIMLSSIKH
jgi:hypothetical protein